MRVICLLFKTSGVRANCEHPSFTSNIDPAKTYAHSSRSIHLLSTLYSSQTSQLFESPDATMPHSTASEGLAIRSSEAEQTDLEELLKTKLLAIPPYHLPALTLSDILAQTPRALSLSNIPPDIQLAFFLRNRAIIDRNGGGEPVKDKALQSLDMTRTIFFYRLNEARQFQRFHDTMRWNTAIFISLLSLPSDAPLEKLYLGHRKSGKKSNDGKMKRPPMSKDNYLPPAARRFMSSYLAAVLEHHNTPTAFTARETFIELWKNGIWDMFTVFSGAQKRSLKNILKQSSKEWEEELDHAECQMGRNEYDNKVAKFVGTIIPGRRDQSLPAPLLAQQGAMGLELSGDAHMGSDVRVSSLETEIQGGMSTSNELLEALRVPFVARKVDSKTKDQEQASRMFEVEATTVADLRYAIAAAQKMKPSDMLPILLGLFPAE
jgi:hypothetical protein